MNQFHFISIITVVLGILAGCNGGKGSAESADLNTDSEGLLDSIRLSGCIYDANNKPVFGAIVSLKEYGASDTTDSQGNWAIEADKISALALFKNNRMLTEYAANESTDSLIYSYQGQIIGIDEIDTLIKSGLMKWVQEYSVSGEIIPDDRVEIDSIQACFDGGIISGFRCVKIGYSQENNAYSGRIFTLVHDIGSEYGYRLWINVMGNGGHKVAISDTINFSTFFGDIDFIKEFRASNNLINGNIVSVNEGLVNEEILFKIQAGKPIAQISWSADSINEKSGDSIVKYKWMMPGTYNVCVRFVDYDGNVDVIKKNIVITNIKTIVRGFESRITTPGEAVYWDMSLSDRDLISSVLIDFGDGSTSQLEGDSILTISHKFASETDVTCGTKKVFTVSLHILDKLGNLTDTSEMVTVINDKPNLEFAKANRLSDFEGKIGGTYKLKLYAKDTGTIASVFWSINGGEFIKSSLDTLIYLPSAATFGYSIKAKVIDNNGNYSDVIEKKINVGDYLVDTRDGKEYRIVRYELGNGVVQEWMASNLKYKNGLDGRCNSVIGDSCDIEGLAYDYFSDAMCPSGWRLPVFDDWTKLSAFAKGVAESKGVANASEILKSRSLWLKGGNGTDDIGFSAYPHSCYQEPESAEGGSVTWWSNQNYDYVSIGVNGNALTYFPSTTHVSCAFAIRCIKK